MSQSTKNVGPAMSGTRAKDPFDFAQGRSAPRRLRVGLGYLRRRGLTCAFRLLRTEVVLGEVLFQKLEAFFGRVHHLEQVKILRRDDSRIRHGLEVDDFVPILTAINDDEDFLGQFLGLRERHDFEQFVHGAEATRKNHQRLSQVREPELPHEKVVELEVERRRDVGVGILLEGQIDVKSDRLTAGFLGAEIRALHNARTSAGGHDETVALGWDLNGPLGEHVGKAAGVFVVASHVYTSLGTLHVSGLLCGCRLGTIALHFSQPLAGVLQVLEASGAEEDDRILDLLAAEAGERLDVLGENAQNPPVGTLQELLVLVGEGAGFKYFRVHKSRWSLVVGRSRSLSRFAGKVRWRVVADRYSSRESHD